MSYQEKKSLNIIIVTLVISIVYSAYVFQKHQEIGTGSEAALQFWAGAILLLIPLKIVSLIVARFVFGVMYEATTKEKKPHIVDERDKSIELRAVRNSLYFFSGGFAISLVFVLITSSLTTMFVTLFVFGILAEVVDQATRMYLYRKEG